MGESNFFGVRHRNSGGGSVMAGKVTQLNSSPLSKLVATPSSLNLGFIAQPYAFHQTVPWWFSKSGQRQAGNCESVGARGGDKEVGGGGEKSEVISPELQGRVNLKRGAISGSGQGTVKFSQGKQAGAEAKTPTGSEAAEKDKVSQTGDVCSSFPFLSSGGDQTPGVVGGGGGCFFSCISVSLSPLRRESREVFQRLQCVCLGEGGVRKVEGEGLSAARSTDPSLPGPHPSPCSSLLRFSPFRSSRAWDFDAWGGT